MISGGFNQTQSGSNLMPYLECSGRFGENFCRRETLVVRVGQWQQKVFLRNGLLHVDATQQGETDHGHDLLVKSMHRKER